MKKLFYLAVAVIVAAGVSSCKKGNGGTAVLKNDIDSLSYAMGMQKAQGLNQYLMQMGLDSAYYADFYRGVKKSFGDGGDKKKEAYNLGVVIGYQVFAGMYKNDNERIFQNDSTQSLSAKKFIEGFIAAAKEKGTAFTVEDAQAYVQTKGTEIQRHSLEKVYADNKKAGEDFLAANAKKDSVVTLPSGVQYKILKQGTGAIVPDSVQVEVNYEGRLIDGTVFDSSYQRKHTATMMAKGTIPGFAEVLTRMPIGSVWEVYIPQDKAYAERNMGKIKPFSTLIFKMELLGLKQNSKK